MFFVANRHFWLPSLHANKILEVENSAFGSQLWLRKEKYGLMALTAGRPGVDCTVDKKLASAAE